MSVSRAAFAVAAVLLVGLLSACTAEGDNAEKWLAGHDIVASVDHNGSYAGLIENATVEATLTDDATDAQIRQLAIDASAFAAHSEGPGALTLALVRDDIAFVVDRQEAMTLETMGSWVKIRDSGKAVSAVVGRDEARVTVADRATMLDVYRELSDAAAALTVYQQDDAGTFELTGDVSCPQIEADGALVADVLADESYASGRIEPCASVVLATGTSEQVVPAVERLLGAETRTGAQGLALSVVYDAEPQMLFQSPAFEVDLSVVTPAVLDRLRAISVLPSTLSFALGADAVLHLVTTGAPATMRPAVAAALDPALDGIAGVVVEAGGLRIVAGTMAEAEPLVDVVDEVAGLGYRNSYFTATGADLTLILQDDDFTLEQGSRFIDLLLTNGLWAGRTVSILDYDHDGAVVADGVAQATSSSVGGELVAYWNEHV